MTEQLEHTDLPVDTAPEEATTEESANSEVVEPQAGEQPERSDNFIPDEALTPEVKKRLNELTWKLHETERKAEAELQAKIKELEAKYSQQDVGSQRPTLAQFDYDDEKYQEALVDWKVEQKVKGLESKFSASAKKTDEDAAAVKWQQNAQAYASEHPEYGQLVQTMGSAVQSQAVAGYLTSSEHGTKLHHHLLNNYAELARIQSLPEWQQGAELAKIEAKMTQVKPKAKSAAPEPVKPLNTGGTAPAKKGSSPFPTSW